MVVPNRHVKDLERLTDVELLDVMRLHNEMMALLKKQLKPHGFNVGISMGRVAGAGILGHVHIHIVPRWIGDHNFMPAISGTKVIPESLNSLYNRLTNGAAGK